MPRSQDTVPARQSLKLFDPSAAVFWEFGQNVQLSRAKARSLELKRPIGQGVAALAAAEQYWPAVQFVHSFAPCPAKVPAGQGRQLPALVEPSARLAFPGLHARQPVRLCPSNSL